jgi:hypothetical protein
MTTAVKTSLCLLALLATPGRIYSQYWGERVQEKGFEQTDFFFMPNTLNPYGLGSFRGVARGLLNDPWLSMSVNPAHLMLDSVGSVVAYTDVRSAKTITDQNPWGGPILADYAVRSSIVPYPYFYNQTTRRVLEPVFSGGVLAAVMPELTVGVTYQLMMQNEKYYSVPQNIYRSVLGEDYSGNRAAAASSIPITDISGGDDKMEQRGHFLSLYASTTLSDAVRLGVKAGRAFFSRNGIYGTNNSWSNSYATNSTWLWGNEEARSEGYNHWEIAGGGGFDFGSGGYLGVSVGYLWGDATQALRLTDTSYSAYGAMPTGSIYQSSGNTLQEWTHHGRTVSVGVDYAVKIAPRATLRLLYERMRTSVDIGLGSSILDTSFSAYGYTYNDTLQTSTSNSLLLDGRSGYGERVTGSHRMLGSVEWTIDDKVRLTAGAQLDWTNTDITTTETVLMRGASRYVSSYSGGYGYLWETGESKDLHWTFSASRSNFQVPILVFARIAPPVELMFGINRVMSWSTIDDVTLAIFRYRQSNDNGNVMKATNFGERYTTPTDESSDVRTTFLAGLTATVSDHVNLRLLLTPNYRDTYDGTTLDEIQWWISVGVKL